MGVTHVPILPHTTHAHKSSVVRKPCSLRAQVVDSLYPIELWPTLLSYPDMSHGIRYHCTTDQSITISITTTFSPAVIKVGRWYSSATPWGPLVASRDPQNRHLPRCMRRFERSLDQWCATQNSFVILRTCEYSSFCSVAIRATGGWISKGSSNINCTAIFGGIEKWNSR